VDKKRKNKLRWFGHVIRRKESNALRVVMKIHVGEKRGRGRERSKKRCLDTIENNMRAIGVSLGDMENRDEWRFKTSVADSK
jgi:hypothetical protein